MLPVPRTWPRQHPCALFHVNGPHEPHQRHRQTNYTHPKDLTSFSSHHLPYFHMYINTLSSPQFPLHHPHCLIPTEIKMSGVWVFSKGVFRLVENLAMDPTGGQQSNGATRRKVLIHTPTNEVITCYDSLDVKLTALGWERYHCNPDLLQYHKRSSVDLISLPKDFAKFSSVHMFDIVVKNHNVFEVRDVVVAVWYTK